MACLMRNSELQFVDVGYLMMEGNPQRDSRCAVSADLDQDGRMDLIYEELQSGKQESVLRVLKNTSRDAHHWIGLNLPQFSKAVGLRTTVRLTNDQQLTHHVLIGDGVSVQNTGSIHFGLGASDRVEAIELAWPDGSSRRISNPALDQYHTLSKNGKD